MGVVAAVTPSTNPAATPVNKAMMAIKGRNAVIIAPSPAGLATTTRTVELMRAELARIGAPEDLVQVLPGPVTKTLTSGLMKACDLVVVTGSQNNVRAAYSSGKPAIGVGAGNVPVIIDASADLDDAARKICASKTFDNATSCSSENSVIIVDSVYEDAIAALERAGAWMADARSKADILVEEDGVGAAHPFSDEKLSLVLTVYRAADLEAATRRVREILEFKGKGHSCGIHTRDADSARKLAEELDVVRVLVNMAHTFGNGGGFDSGLNFTLSICAG